MASKKAKAALQAVKSKIRQWTFNVSENPGEYVGEVRDENGWLILRIVEDFDYNQLSRLLNTSKYMQNKHDMRGLAKYLMDRGLVPLNEEEKEKWKKDKIVPIEVKEVRV